MTAVGLDPRPIGWFAVARSAELRPGQERRGVFCAAPYVLRRQSDGSLAHEGSIVATVEQNGFVFAWHHPHGAAPCFSVPALDEAGWRPLSHSLLHARTHPQEITENSVDSAHFTCVHHYNDIQVLEPMQVDGHQMRVRYSMTRGGQFNHFGVLLNGISCGYTHIETPSLGLRIRLLIFSMPTEPGHVEVRIAVSLGDRMALPFGRLLLPLLQWLTHRKVISDFKQDIVVWNAKRYLERPFLVKGDGPIMAFRRFASQFYAQASEGSAP